MDANWIVFANASRAYIYSANYKDTIESVQLITKLEHPASRKKRQDLVSDKPGHYQAGESSRGTYSSHSDPKEIEFDKFAREIADFLEESRVAKKYKSLILVMAPHFLGLLMKHFPKFLHQKVKKVLEKEIILNTEHEFKKYIDILLHEKNFPK